MDAYLDHLERDNRMARCYGVGVKRAVNFQQRLRKKTSFFGGRNEKIDSRHVIATKGVEEEEEEENLLEAITESRHCATRDIDWLGNGLPRTKPADRSGPSILMATINIHGGMHLLSQ